MTNDKRPSKPVSMRIDQDILTLIDQDVKASNGEDCRSRIIRDALREYYKARGLYPPAPDAPGGEAEGDDDIPF